MTDPEQLVVAFSHHSQFAALWSMGWLVMLHESLFVPAVLCMVLSGFNLVMCWCVWKEWLDDT